MKASEVFVKRDERRNKIQVQPMGWVTLGLMGVLVATIGVACWRDTTGPDVGPTATATTAPTPSPTSDEPKPSATPIVNELCPSDPATWTLVPYEVEGDALTYYMISPHCVMDAVEQVYLDYTAAKLDHGRYWTLEDALYYQYWEGDITAPFSGKLISPPDPESWSPQCIDGEKADGTPITLDDIRVAYVTITTDKTVAEVAVLGGGYDRIARYYDCDTGELISEMELNDGFLGFWPMVYNEEIERWQIAWNTDIYWELTAEEVENDATITVMLNAQRAAGRE